VRSSYHAERQVAGSLRRRHDAPMAEGFIALETL
jgi:hypothetical protein